MNHDKFCSNNNVFAILYFDYFVRSGARISSFRWKMLTKLVSLDGKSRHVKSTHITFYLFLFSTTFSQTKHVEIDGFRPSSRQKWMSHEKQPKLYLTRAPEDLFYKFSSPFPSHAHQKKTVVRQLG